MTHYIWQNEEWPEFRWNDAVLLKPLGECRLRQGTILAKMSSLGFDCEQEAQRDILIEEAITTSAIEGEKLSRESVRSSIARKMGLSSAGLPVDRNADGLVDILLDAVQNHSRPLTSERLFGWHAALFPTGYSGLHKIITGNWRATEPMQVVSGGIGHEKVHFEAMPYDRVEAEMDSFFRWWRDSLGEMDGILRAAVAHFRFITIHPFEDGNGRIARALTDMALAQDDKQSMRYYSLSSQINSERDSYYDVLERSQKGDMDITDWLQWFSGRFGRSIESSEKNMALVLDKASFWYRHTQTELSDRQRKVINKLLDSGRNGFGGGLTNRKYASMTKVSRAMATRELQHLKDLGLIKANPGKGRSANYDLAWD